VRGSLGAEVTTSAPYSERVTLAERVVEVYPNRVSVGLVERLFCSSG
jgi:hypothetical protein